MDLCVLTTALSYLLLLLAEFRHAAAYVINADKQGITCWTCPNKGSNSECNDWAPDRLCPNNQTVCQTVHRFTEATGQSVQVNKRCVEPVQCTHGHVGCHSEAGVQVCVSCCNTPYCNKDAPHNNATAINLSVTILQQSSASYMTFHWSVITLLLPVIVLAST